MPQTKKESWLFTCTMCLLMVLGMTLYNITLHGNLSLGTLVSGLPLAFGIALVLDVFVVAKPAKKIALKLPTNKEKMWQVGISISVCMILGMVSFMSIFGIVVESGWQHLNVGTYFHTWLLNFIMALPLQLLLVRPLALKVLNVNRTLTKSFQEDESL
ncbi:hypothetical protein EsVE80_25690 [Enterococcus saigonensis]|uniref:DUF2798 domain-containing protein n=1 Tax=Enterococcus saigonensis TaxID=1805431 RepID=A0A679IP13_9ENTE|nr:DUF2798 domain-containing protein [Enterococcus saigonensis]BCA87046.1 hypothetical protein EsVE80_25690 [Enterococcus saigonensis]